ncbi:MAG TPA: hypothetical protein VIH99_10155 [Bdellovibrionota bacterium]|jgi:hypothetical protein
MRIFLTIAGLFLAMNAPAFAHGFCRADMYGRNTCRVERYRAVSPRWDFLGCVAYPQACAGKAASYGYALSSYSMGCGSNGSGVPTWGCYGSN